MATTTKNIESARAAIEASSENSDPNADVCFLKVADSVKSTVQQTPEWKPLISIPFLKNSIQVFSASKFLNDRSFIKLSTPSKTGTYDLSFKWNELDFLVEHMTTTPHIIRADAEGEHLSIRHLKGGKGGRFLYTLITKTNPGKKTPKISLSEPAAAAAAKIFKGLSMINQAKKQAKTLDPKLFHEILIAAAYKDIAKNQNIPLDDAFDLQKINLLRVVRTMCSIMGIRFPTPEAFEEMRPRAKMLAVGAEKIKAPETVVGGMIYLFQQIKQQQERTSLKRKHDDI